MNCLLVVPHFQHLEHLREFLPTLVDGLDGEISILVSDDGSGTESARSLERLIDSERSRTGAKPDRLRPPLLTSRNRGKGHAVYAGWRTATDCEWLAFVDADGAVTVREINRAWAHLTRAENASDVLIGSRVAKLGRNVERTLYRHVSGRIFATIATLLSGLHVYDSQCGLKFIRASVFQEIAPFITAERFSFDMELLMLAAAAGHRIEEFPIDWRHVSGGKVSVLRDSLPMLLELLGAKQNVRKYQRLHPHSLHGARTME
jgi:glycosyltransferase involved in cell wall biosynthesis